MKKQPIVFQVIALIAGLMTAESVPALSDGDEGVPDYLRAESRAYQKKYNREPFDLTDTDVFLSRRSWWYDRPGPGGSPLNPVL